MRHWEFARGLVPETVNRLQSSSRLANAGVGGRCRPGSEAATFSVDLSMGHVADSADVRAFSPRPGELLDLVPSIPSTIPSERGRIIAGRDAPAAGT